MESGLVVDQLALRCKDSEVVAPGYVSHMLVSASYIRGYLETVTDKRSVLRIQNIVHISPALSYEQSTVWCAELKSDADCCSSSIIFKSFAIQFSSWKSLASLILLNIGMLLV